MRPLVLPRCTSLRRWPYAPGSRRHFCPGTGPAGPAGLSRKRRRRSAPVPIRPAPCFSLSPPRSPATVPGTVPGLEPEACFSIGLVLGLHSEHRAPSETRG